jgi:death-on-curing protein
VSRLVVDAIQTDMLLTHGGMPGLRDENALESALARPKQRLSSDPEADLAALAAAYGYGLVRDRLYNDGNKRVAFMVMAVFLGLNSCELVASEAEVVTTIVALASGELDEETLERWIRWHVLERVGRSNPSSLMSVLSITSPPI